jgi:hypothetical protein
MEIGGAVVSARTTYHHGLRYSYGICSSISLNRRKQKERMLDEGWSKALAFQFSQNITSGTTSTEISRRYR